MAAKPRSWRCPDSINDRYEAFCDDYGVNDTEAHKILISRGLLSFGYTGEDSSAYVTVLAFWLDVLAKSLGIMAVGLLAAAVVVEPGALVYAAALGVLAWLAQAAERREPRWTKWFGEQYRDNQTILLEDVR